MTARLVCLGSCLSLLPFAVGCVEDVKADPKDKPVTSVSAASLPADPSKAAKKPPVEFSDLPATDPLVVEAVRAREQVARLEEDLLERLDEVRAALAAAQADPDRLRESVGRFVDLTTDVRRKTAQAGDALHAVGEKTAELSRSSRHLAASYRALADLYRRKARDYSEPRLRDQLAGFAADYDAVAAAMPERCKTLDAVRKRLPALQRKVTEVNAFLGDAVAFLNSHPGVGADRRERYSAEFESFAVTFSEWLRVLDDLRAALRERAVSTAIRESYRKEVAEEQKREAARRDDLARVEREKQVALTRVTPPEQERESPRASDRKRPAAADPRVVASVPSPVVTAPVCHSPPVYHLPTVTCSRPVVYSTPLVCPGRTVVVVRRCPW